MSQPDAPKPVELVPPGGPPQPPKKKLGRPRKGEVRGGITKATFAGKKATVHQAVEWVLGNFMLSDVVPDDAPSAFAWTYLVKAREHPKLAEYLFTKQIDRMLPNKTELSTANKVEDDGRDVLRTLTRLRAQAKGE